MKIWKTTNLALEGEIVIFKTIEVSKVVFQLFITTVPKYIVKELEEIEKAFFWKDSTPKIKHETLCNVHKAGDLKNFDILNKIIALQYSLIRRLYDNSLHEWKLIPLYFIGKSFGTSFNFHSDLLFKTNKTKFFSSFYRELYFN